MASPRLAVVSNNPAPPSKGNYSRVQGDPSRFGATGLPASPNGPSAPTHTSTGQNLLDSKIIQMGVVRAASLAQVQAEQDEKEQALEIQHSTHVTGLASYVRTAWSHARDAKMQDVNDRMMKSLRARRSEYDPERIAFIREMGGSEVYAPLTSVKCRAAASWLRDVLLANGSDKPWSIRPTPVPSLPPNLTDAIVQQATLPIMQAKALGVELTDDQIMELLGTLRDMTMNEIRMHAKTMSERMEAKMEDQLLEGGFFDALNDFVDDLVTFPAAIVKGPIVRNENQLRWVRTSQGYQPQITRDIKLEWERVSPFDIYPSPESAGINDGYLLQKHRLSRRDLNAMIGVDGYDDAAIRMVLDDYGRNGLRNWLYDDVGRVDAEGKSIGIVSTNPDHLIDALQFWGDVSGQNLRDFGVPESEVPDVSQEYSAEVWLVGNYVLKATLNAHPLGCKPYFKTSYEEIPGAFWGNAPPDHVRDAQTVVNAGLRALVNNMSLASGPQVVVNVDRLASGEQISQLSPWRIWQVSGDTTGSGQANAPVQFEQPDSRIAEMFGVIKGFMDYADEWSGVPRYLTGDAPGGAGRTASGLSMLMSNAGKTLKQVVGNIDNNVLEPLLQQLYYWNMRYSEDMDLKGDVQIAVRGANALVAKETAMVRRSEFLALTNNPVDLQIVGLDGRGEILREVVKGLDMPTDSIIPNAEVLRVRQATAQKQQELAAQAQLALAGPKPQQEGQSAPGGTPAKPGGPSQSGQTLMDGAPTTDNFSPPSQ